MIGRNRSRNSRPNCPQDCTGSFPVSSWSCSDQNFDAGTSFPFGRGDGLVKLFGPDPVKLTELADKVRLRLAALPGVLSVGGFGIGNHSDLQFMVVKEKCTPLGIPVGRECRDGDGGRNDCHRNEGRQKSL